jgi:linoleoyl-CoA desaturase
MVTVWIFTVLNKSARMSFIAFKTKEHPFFDELKRKVDAYFDQTGKSRWGDWKIYLKTGILISTMIGLYVWLVFFTPGVLLSLFLCAILGLTLAGIGFNVMHDGAHGSYSKYTWLNNMMGYTLNLMGGDVHLWKTKHNQIHHSFTNVEGIDDDIDIQPFMRLNLHQKKYWIHRFQHIYGFIFYALNYLFWVFYFDYKKYFSGKIGDTKIRKYKTKDHISFWLTKLVYMFVFIALPIWMVGFVPMLLGYTMLTVVCGTVIAIVFQLAHVVEETEFLNPVNKDQAAETEWAVHQIQTTSNFATRNKIVHWFTGGLNHQVEHHLFPRISHVHYPALNKIVKETCEQFGIQYNEHRTVMLAVKSHVVHLREMGRRD